MNRLMNAFRLLAKRRIAVGSAVVLGIIFTSIAACSDTERSEGLPLFKVSVLIDWVHEPTYLGVFYAQDAGIFKRFGLDVDIVEVQGANKAVSAIANGQYLVSTAAGGATVLSFNQYKNIRSLGVIYQDVATVAYGIGPNELKSARDFVGKRVGIYPGSVNNNEFKAVLLGHGVDPESVEIVAIAGSDVALLLEGKIDYALNYEELSPVQLQLELKRRGDDRGVTVYRLSQSARLGYGLNIISSKEQIEENPEIINKITLGILLGYNEGCHNRGDAIEMFRRRFGEFSKEYVEKSWDIVCGQIRFPVGAQTIAGWQETIDVFRKLGLLSGDVDGEQILLAR